MKEQIRRGVFETNSSSTHSITMCTESEYEQWKKGELLLDYWNEKFITKEELENEYGSDWEECIDHYDYRTYDYFWNEAYLEGYESSYTTPNGETVIAFGLYGYDG